ncbi:MAG: LysR family transcriptional regulator [Gammaproteobacteria bacterium]|nr:MAG: LysR family transcriptional regulator [Gammaproteobacteria bacterium]
MDWDDLRIFLAVADAGSVRGAATRLGVSHSTVSRRIDGFEKELGVRLFDRLSAGYTLTPAGDDIVGLGTSVSTTIDEIERRIVGQDSRLTGEIRVTAPDLLACSLLMPDIEAFNRRYPEIGIELSVSYVPVDLRRREADVAIRITDTPPEHLVGRRLGRYASAIYVSNGYAAEHDLDDHSTLHWIGWNDLNRFPEWVRESAFPNVPTRGRFPNAMVQLAAARAGLGLAMIPCFMGDPDPALVRVVPEPSLPDHEIWILTHPDLRDTSRIRAFMRHIADCFARRRDLLSGEAPS